MKVGLVINPVAGLGGKTAHFGSDNVQIADRASVLGVEHLSHKRGMMFLNSLTSILTNEEWHCIDLVLSALPKDISDENWRGFVAQENVKELAWPQAEGGHATTQLCQQMISFNVDLLVFVGGDGTARDVLAAVGQQIPVVGVPAGVKMHSGVFAVTPVAAAKVLVQMIRGELVSRVEQDVRDFDNTSSGAETTHISVKTFGHMLVPESGQFMQHTKVGGIEILKGQLQTVGHGCLSRLQRKLVLGLHQGQNTRGHLAIFVANAVQVRGGVFAQRALRFPNLRQGLCDQVFGAQDLLFGPVSIVTKPEDRSRQGQDTGGDNAQDRADRAKARQDLRCLLAQ